MNYLIALLTFVFSIGQAMAFEIHGHRGARSIYPENTLSGFAYAIENGADFIEIDIRLTKDKDVVIYHDSSLNNELCIIPSNISKRDSSLKVKNILLQEMLEIDCGSKTDPDFPRQISLPGEKVPSFEQLLEMMNRRENAAYQAVKINIEFKVDSFMSSSKKRTLMERTLDLVQNYNFEDRVMLQSFDKGILILARQANQSIPISYLGRINNRSIGLALDYRFQGINPKFTRLSKSKIERLKSQGLKVVPYTSNKSSQWQELIEMGVDGIITDDPEGLRDFYCSNYSCSEMQ